MHVDLRQGRFGTAERVNLSGLDDEHIARAGLELLAVDGPDATPLLDELHFVVGMTMRSRAP